MYGKCSTDSSQHSMDDDNDKEFYDCKKVSVGKKKVYVPKSMTKSAVKRLLHFWSST